MDAIVASVAPSSLISVGLDIVAQRVYAANSSGNLSYPAGAKYGLVYAVGGINMPSATLFKVGLPGDVKVGVTDVGPTTLSLAPTTFTVIDREVTIVWYG